MTYQTIYLIIYCLSFSLFYYLVYKNDLIEENVFLDIDKETGVSLLSILATIGDTCIMIHDWLFTK